MGSRGSVRGVRLSYPTMSQSQEPAPRRRSAFAAAFLSLIFPGLGHAYAGAYTRALGFAAGPILFLALGAGIGLRMNGYELLGYAVQFLDLIQILNVLVLLYRIAAAVDAYRVAGYLNGLEAGGGGRLGWPRGAFDPVSIAGLVAVILVMSVVHVAVASYDLQAQSVRDCVFDPDGTAHCEDTSTSPSPGSSTSDTDSLDSPSPTIDLGTPVPGATAAPAETIKPWTGGRLNILLVGVDQRANQSVFNTDTLIVASVDPKTNQVSMFSLPRDTIQVPLASRAAQNVWGSVFPCKINGLWAAAQARPDVFPGGNGQRGYQALKDTLANLYGLDIPYYAEVNFDGFKKVIDAVGGVTINVQIPVLDDSYPGDDRRSHRLYIPAGLQHMTGAEALEYARSRHVSSDYDRAARQQRVLFSLKDQVDVKSLLPKLPDLVAAFKSTIHTDIPVSALPQMLQLAASVDTSSIRSYVFAPPLYGASVNSPKCGDSNTLYVNKVRQAVKDALSGNATDEARKQTIADEGASVWVLNGSGRSGQAADVAAFLEYQGISASAPTQKPPKPLTATKIVVYNGHEADAPATVAYLEALFGVQATLVSDTTARVDIVITTGSSTANLQPPPAP
jgi:LCP family protein required for cell wall assembly